MKKSILLFLSLFTFIYSFAGWTPYTINFDGKAREYKIYTPNNLAPDAKVVVLLHGLGATMNDFDYSSWPTIADSANIILIAPQGLSFNSFIGVIEGVFNSGMVLPIINQGVNADVNDIGFINFLMDEVASNYSTSHNRVYITGFSNGGFMTQRCACELTSKIAAIASVSGTRSAAYPPCNDGFTMPVAHFHGDMDSVVTWGGYVATGTIGAQLGISVDSLLNDWKITNNAFDSEVSSTIGDVNASLYLTHTEYKTPSGESMVELFKVHGGVHAYYGYMQTANKFDIAHETWKFFNKHKVLGVAAVENSVMPTFAFYPNPVNDQLYVDGDLSKLVSISIYSVTGELIKTILPSTSIDVSYLPSGVYLLKVVGENGESASYKLLK